MTTRNTATLHLEQVLAAWHGLTQYVPLGPILTESDYTQRVQILESLLETIGANEAHPLGDLLDLLATQIGAYEAQQPPMAEATPLEVLRSLMEEHGLTQTDIAQDVGGQSVWDNAPHYPAIGTFPYHLHDGAEDHVVPHPSTTGLEALPHVLEAIEAQDHPAKASGYQSTSTR